MDDGIHRSTADIQLVGYISDRNPSVLLNHLWSGWMAQSIFINNACADILEFLNPLVYPYLCNTVFSHCDNILH